MRLNTTEKQMLAGEYGPACKLAMDILCELGQLYGAQKMIPICQAHIDMTLYMVDAGVEFVQRMADLGGKFAVQAQLNPASIDLIRHRKMRVPKDLLEKSRHLEQAYQKMGAIASWTCAPYQQGLIPRFGEQIAWGESNAVAFVNSVIGARTERYADLTDVCAAITGRVPAMGLHLAENRRPEILVQVKDLPASAFADDRIYPLLGYVFGEMAEDRVAALFGMPGQVSVDNLKAFSAAAASSGAVGLFHLVGITPEAPDLETCFQGKIPETAFFITRKMMDQAADRLDQGSLTMPDLIALGCPHYSHEECEALVRFLDKRTITGNLAFWVFTSRKTYASITDQGILQEMEKSGIQVFTDGCPLQYPKKNWAFTTAMSDSAKFANYCFSQTGLNVVFAGTRDCVETAVAGKLRRTPLWK